MLAFQIAARGAFRDGMKQGKAGLMEPIMQVCAPRCFLLSCTLPPCARKLAMECVCSVRVETACLSLSLL